MSIVQKIRDQFLQARKSKNQIEKSILSVVLGEVENLTPATAKSAKPVTDDQVCGIIKKTIKNNRITIESLQSDDSRLACLQKENEVLESFLPQYLDESQVESALVEIRQNILDASGDGPATGQAMKCLREQGHAVEGQVVSSVVSKIRKELN